MNDHFSYKKEKENIEQIRENKLEKITIAKYLFFIR